MADKFSEEKRSEIMSKIRSKWTSNEKFVHNLLKGNRIKHKMHPPLQGNPDIFIGDRNTVVFIDGCFWHNCPTHGHPVYSNKAYWAQKIKRNVKRDKKNTKLLKKLGYRVVRLWEHEITEKTAPKILRKVIGMPLKPRK